MNKICQGGVRLVCHGKLQTLSFNQLFGYIQNCSMLDFLSKKSYRHLHDAMNLLHFLEHKLIIGI